MAEISLDFRNIVSSKKCAIPAPRIVSLEIGDESSSIESESAFHGYFLNEAVSLSDVKCERNSICGCDKQSDKIFLNISQSSLSPLTYDEHPSDKIKSTNDIDNDLLDLLNSTNLKEASESCKKNYNSKSNTSADKMKISNGEVSNDFSDFLSSISQEISGEEVNATSKYCQRKSTQDCRSDLDFDFAKNENIGNSLLSNNSSLKVESNLSEILSSINIENSDVSKVGSCNSNNMHSSIFANKFESEKMPCVVDLSDLLSSIDRGHSNDNKIDKFSESNVCNTNVVKTKNESCLSDLLSSIDIDKSNKSTLGEEPSTDDLSDLLSSIDIAQSNDNKVGKFSKRKVCNTNVKTKKESCFSDLLSSIDIDKSKKSILGEEPDSEGLCDLLSSIDNKKYNNKFDNGNQVNIIMEVKTDLSVADLLSSIDKSNQEALALSSNKPSFCGSSNLMFKNNNEKSYSLNDFNFDIACSSSSSSCTSSYSDTENNFPESSLTKKDLRDKMSETDSGYSSFDFAQKEFSFFDYSSDNRFSFNSLLSKKLDVNIPRKGDCKDGQNVKEEMSMSDLLTIVSPEFKNPVLATLNKRDKLDSNTCEVSSSMADLIESLNIKSKDSNLDVISNDRDEKLMAYDCTDGQISKKVQTGASTFGFQTDDSIENEDKFIDKNVLNSDEIVHDDEQDFFIDLRECVKSVKHQFTPMSPIKQVKNNETQNSKCFSPNKILFDCEMKSHSDLSKRNSDLFELKDTVPRKKIRVNAKQTLFSKALACKPKYDPTLLQKVANIKKELLSSIIHRPVFIDCDVSQPIVESVVQADRCTLPSIGRRSFGLDVPCESQ